MTYIETFDIIYSMIKAVNARKKVKPVAITNLKHLNKTIRDASLKGSYCTSVHSKGSFVKKITNKLDSLGYYYIVYYKNLGSKNIYPTVPFLINEDDVYIITINWVING